jgi:hypothetical protein
MNLNSGRNIIYSNEGKGDYVTVNDLKVWLEQQKDNVPTSFQDASGIWQETVRTLIGMIDT